MSFFTLRIINKNVSSKLEFVVDSRVAPEIRPFLISGIRPDIKFGISSYGRMSDRIIKEFFLLSNPVILF